MQFSTYALALTLLLSLVPATVAAEPGTISTRGSATVEAAPDRATIEVGVLTTASEADRAVNTNNETMARVVAAIRKVGIAERNLRTRGLQVQPIWSNRNNGQDRRITGFQVNNRVEVSTRNLDLAGRILQVAVQAGANTAGNLRFDIADPAPLRERALQQATKKALREAQTLAEAAGLALGTIRSLSTGGPAPMPMLAMRMEADMARSVSQPPISPGLISVSADVHLTVEASQP